MNVVLCHRNAWACDVNETLMRNTIDAFVTLGLRAAGFEYVSMDGECIRLHGYLTLGAGPWCLWCLVLVPGAGAGAWCWCWCLALVMVPGVACACCLLPIPIS